MGTACSEATADVVTKVLPQIPAETNFHPHNAATLHPAFFTERLRKSPIVVGSGMMDSPVTQGYAYQDAERRRLKL